MTSRRPRAHAPHSRQVSVSGSRVSAGTLQRLDFLERRGLGAAVLCGKEAGCPATHLLGLGILAEDFI